MTKLLGWLGSGLMNLLCVAIFIVSAVVSIYFIVHVLQDVYNWIF